jgi:hypothetical protein
MPAHCHYGKADAAIESGRSGRSPTGPRRSKLPGSYGFFRGWKRRRRHGERGDRSRSVMNNGRRNDGTYATTEDECLGLGWGVFRVSFLGFASRSSEGAKPAAFESDESSGTGPNHWHVWGARAVYGGKQNKPAASTKRGAGTQKTLHTSPVRIARFVLLRLYVRVTEHSKLAGVRPRHAVPEPCDSFPNSFSRTGNPENARTAALIVSNGEG